MRSASCCPSAQAPGTLLWREERKADLFRVALTRLSVRKAQGRRPLLPLMPTVLPLRVYVFFLSWYPKAGLMGEWVLRVSQWIC